MNPNTGADNQQSISDTIAALMTPNIKNAPNSSLSMYYLDVGLMGTPDKEDLELADEMNRNAEFLQKLNDFDPTTAYLQAVTQLKDPTSPIAQFMSNLGISLEDPSIENLKNVTDKLNSEIINYITDLRKKREKVSNQSPYRYVSDLLMAIAVASPESLEQVGGLLMVMAPRIKENAIRQIDEEIIKSTAAQSDLANRTTQISSLAENRKMNIVKFVGDTALKLTKMDFDKLKALADKWLDRFKARLARLRLGLQEKQTRDKTAMDIYKQYIAYENMMLRHIEKITPATQEGRAARLQMLDRLYKANMETRAILRGTGFDNLITPITQEFITTVITAPDVMDFLATTRRDFLRSATSRNYAEIKKLFHDMSISTGNFQINSYKIFYGPVFKEAIDRFKSAASTVNFRFANKTQANQYLADAARIAAATTYFTLTQKNAVETSQSMRGPEKEGTLASVDRFTSDMYKIAYGFILHKALPDMPPDSNIIKKIIDTANSVDGEIALAALKEYVNANKNAMSAGLLTRLDQRERNALRKLEQIFEGDDANKWLANLNQYQNDDDLKAYLMSIKSFGSDVGVLEEINNQTQNVLGPVPTGP